MNICFDNDSSRGSSNSSTCNILSSLTVLIWVWIVTSEAFSLSEMIWFRLYSSWITIDEIKSRSQEKHVTLSSKFYSLLSHERSSLFQWSLYLSFSTKQFITACRSLSSISQEKLLVKISRLCHALWKSIFADNQQKFDSRTTSALYMLSYWL